MKITNESIERAKIVFGSKGWGRSEKERFTDNDEPEFSVMLERKNPKDGVEFIEIKTSFEDFITETFAQYRDLDLDDDNYQLGNFVIHAEKLISLLEKGIMTMQDFMDGKSEECDLNLELK